MIKALIFDLDGTLIQTEVLKATSYAQAIQQLTDHAVGEQQVLDVFGKFVGLSREKVVEGLYREFQSELELHLGSQDSDHIKEHIINRRLSIYDKILKDEVLLSKHFCPFTLKLLHKAHSEKLQIVLATMSHLPQTTRMTTILGIADKLDLILTRDDVDKGKPDPEIYLKAKNALQLGSDECLVIEDSVNGIKAGLSAGMQVFAVTNNVTRHSVHSCNLLDDAYIVDTLEDLSSRVFGFIQAET
ncbi:HAD family hydrolase [Ulvibacterium marinum]|uniref:HAD family hydrolase n=1 Tax=Ulvibacterium marinum TaxID=2419782 RepID=UPI002493D4AE|nr:HAD family phosphatase [Ulvibacterium marinum]